MSDAKPEPEPSMEEILASISRIMADDTTPNASAEPAAEKKNDILELTEAVDENGTVRRLAPAHPAAEPAPHPGSDRTEGAAPAPAGEGSAAARPAQSERDRLLSVAATGAAAAALGKLANLPRRPAGEGTSPSGGPRTLEDIVGEALRPLLQDWLDEHLPEIVERLVREEIARVVKEAGLR